MDEGPVWKPGKKVPNPSGKGLERRLLCRTPKSVASRYHQLLISHTVIAPYLRDEIYKKADDKCWWCGGGKRQTRYHLL